MFILKKLVSAVILPPFCLFLLLLAGVCLTHRWPRLGRFLTVGSLILLMLLSIPLVGVRLLRTLEESPPIAHLPSVIRDTLQPAEAIVVLGGGSYPGAVEYGGDTVNAQSLERLRYAAYLQRISGKPLLVTGGAPFGGRPEAELMRQTLIAEFGVPVRWAETASRDTSENALFSARLLQQDNIAHVVLVTHAWHMSRAQGLFERQGVTVIAAPTGFTHDSPSWLEDLLPKVSALDKSSTAIREWLGLLWYRLCL